MYKRTDKKEWKEPADWAEKVSILQGSVTTLCTKYDLNEYSVGRIQEIAQDTIKEVKESNGTGTQLLTAAKAAFLEFLQRRRKDEVGKLGKMPIYAVWDAKRINGNEWLFYPTDHKDEVHLAWIPGEDRSPIHVRFDEGAKTQTIDYGPDLKYRPMERKGQSHIPNAKTDADKYVRDWQAEMAHQVGVRAAIAWLSE